jgi:hypothetical protein
MDRNSRQQRGVARSALSGPNAGAFRGCRWLVCCGLVAQVSQPAVSRVSKPAGRWTGWALGCSRAARRLGNRRHGRFGNLRYHAQPPTALRPPTANLGRHRKTPVHPEVIGEAASSRRPDGEDRHFGLRWQSAAATPLLPGQARPQSGSRPPARQLVGEDLPTRRAGGRRSGAGKRDGPGGPSLGVS